VRAKIIFWFIGILGLISFSTPFNHSPSFSYQDNVLYDRLIRISLINFSIIILLIPSLVKHGLLTNNYLKADRYTKAKNDLILILLALPGLVLFFCFAIMAYDKIIVILIVASFLLYRFLHSLLFVLTHQKKVSKGGK